MTAKQLQFGVFHGFEYAWVAPNHPDLVPLVVTIPPGRKVKACVVVNKESAFKSLADLKDETVTVPRGAKAHCLLYLDTKRAGLPSTTARPKLMPGKTAEDALDAVVTGDSQAALVDAAALAGYQSLHPGSFTQLRVLCESEKFPPAVIAYRRGSVDEATLAQVKAGMVKAHQTATSRPLMMLWNLQGFEVPSADYQRQLTEIRNAYPAPENPAAAK
jgi:ABC-type phosphate/phosphonate transport system substrate-binding protein